MKPSRLLLVATVVIALLGGTQVPAFANHPVANPAKKDYETFPVNVAATPSLEGTPGTFTVAFDSQNELLGTASNNDLPLLTWIHMAAGSRFLPHAADALTPSPIGLAVPNGPTNDPDGPGPIPAGFGFPGTTCGGALTPACIRADYGDLVTTVSGSIDLHDFPTVGSGDCSAAAVSPSAPAAPRLLDDFTLPAFAGGALVVLPPSQKPTGTVAYANLVIPGPATVGGLGKPTAVIPTQTILRADTTTPITGTFPGGAPGITIPATAFSSAHYDVQTTLPFGVLATALCPSTPFHAVTTMYSSARNYALYTSAQSLSSQGLPNPATYADTKPYSVNGVHSTDVYTCVNYADITDLVTLTSRHTSCDRLDPSGIADLTINPSADPKPGIALSSPNAAGKPLKFKVAYQNTSKKQEWLTGQQSVSIYQAGVDTLFGTPDDQTAYSGTDGIYLTADDVSFGASPQKGDLKNGASTFVFKPGGSVKQAWTTSTLTAGLYEIKACISPIGQMVNADLGLANCATRQFTQS